MTPEAARKILGLGPDEDPRPYLPEFKDARERIATMVRAAPTEVLADRYQKGLIEFDKALAAIQEELEALGQAAPPLPLAKPAEEEPAATVTVEKDRGGRALFYLCWLVILLTGVAGGGWIYLESERAKEEQRLIRVAFLERQGAILIENRRWQEAAGVFAEVELIAPESDIAALGRRSIEAGMAEEQTQFISYWTGQATAELEAGRLDDAVVAARQVLDRFPTEKEAAALLGRISAARITQERAAAIAGARQKLEEGNWSAAISAAGEILSNAPDDADALAIVTDAESGMARASADRMRALELLEMAIARDKGEFDQQALDWLREANSLAPNNAEIAARLEKLSAYTRTIRVPGDFDSLVEALASARDRDRIVLGAETWKGPLVINVAVELQGAGAAETRVECAPEDGSAITIGPDARGARVSGIAFRHEAFAAGDERFSVGLVRGGQVTFADCRFSDGSGHGLAVIENGQATVSRCKFTENGWNGIAAIGAGSTLEASESECSGNFENGIESWDGAAVILTKNRCERNSRNGIHADNGLASASIEGNQLVANREFGLVLNSAGAGKVIGNTARANLLGGFVIRAAAANLAFSANQSTLNQGPGLILEKGLSPSAYAKNTVSKNSRQQVLADADLSLPDEMKRETGEVPRASIVVEPAELDPR